MRPRPLLARAVELYAARAGLRAPGGASQLIGMHIRGGDKMLAARWRIGTQEEVAARARGAASRYHLLAEQSWRVSAA